MATWTNTGLNNASRFKAAQSTVSSANSAMELAVQYQRYNFSPSTLNASPPVPCWPGASTASLSLPDNSANVSSWCSMLWFFGSALHTRIMTISTCLSSVTATACAAAPLLQAVVYYDDYRSAGGANTCTSTTSTGTCGVNMVVHSWVFVPIPPVVTGNLVGTGTTCATTKPFTLYGTGFSSPLLSPANVYFIFAGTSNTTTYPASNVTVVNSGQLTACEPTAPVGLATGTATVIVTSATGTSAQLTTPTSADQISWP